ncbi:MAG: hypothetical protein HXX10_05605 [Rhodoplanes sp.]|uniref:hypothetical protein n=1 Tax=Rhodoplanes sp. TaxID=1968906 RepID=UPI00182DDEA4|nr:hypothetical protein [Rhodoplanes sp.]NVO13496.1 hypothetical protein [Rhodoplanes sp.]
MDLLAISRVAGSCLLVSTPPAGGSPRLASIERLVRIAGRTLGTGHAPAQNSRNTGTGMQDQSYLDDLSVRAAVAGWRAGEEVLSAEFRAAPVLTAGLIDRWLNFFGLTDRLRLGQREQFVGFLERTARPALRDIGASSPETFALVDEINFEAVRQRITSASLTMLLSLFACVYAPAIFSPITQHSRRGIQILGHRLADMSYRSFMLAVMKEREHFADRIAALRSAHEVAGNGFSPVPLDVVVMRALDQRLMLAGGYPPDELEAVIRDRGAAAAAKDRIGRHRAAPGRPLQADRAAG